MYTFPYNAQIVHEITGLPLAQCDPGVIAIESSWTDTVSLYMVANTPEVGPPIRRLRSKNVKHTLPISFTISNYWYNKLWLPFIGLINGGIDQFKFPEITYNREVSGGSTDIRTVNAWLSFETNGSPFNVKRQDNYTYLVSATICWNSEGALNAN